MIISNNHVLPSFLSDLGGFNHRPGRGEERKTPPGIGGEKKASVSLSLGLIIEKLADSLQESLGSVDLFGHFIA